LFIESAGKDDSKENETMGRKDTIRLEVHEKGSSETTSDLSRGGVAEISDALRPLLADVFALYVKAKNFH